jgi:hypothetical protein
LLTHIGDTSNNALEKKQNTQQYQGINKWYYRDNYKKNKYAGNKTKKNMFV